MCKIMYYVHVEIISLSLDPRLTDGHVQLTLRLNSLCVHVHWLCPVVSDYCDEGCGTMQFFFELSLSFP